MRRSKFRRPCKVLIFNGARVLVAIVRSLHCAAELTHENKSAIHNCCTGKSVRSGIYYYRQLHPDILLDMDDLDKLTLNEYDDLCGIKRKYISTRKMAHIRQRARDRQRMKIATPTGKWTNNDNYQSIRRLQRCIKQMPTLLSFAHLAILRYFSKSARWVFNFSGRQGAHL